MISKRMIQNDLVDPMTSPQSPLSGQNVELLNSVVLDNICGRKSKSQISLYGKQRVIPSRKLPGLKSDANSKVP